MKRIVLVALLAALAIGERAAAQTASPAPAPTLGTAPPGAGPMGRGRMAGPGRGMRGPGGGMGGGGMGMCPILIENAERVEVKKLADGVTMTFTSSDPAEVARIQKMAEAMRLMHEAATE